MPDFVKIAKVGIELAEELAPSARFVDEIGPLAAVKNSLGELTQLLGHNPEARARLDQLPDYLHLIALNFVKQNPERNLAILEKRLSNSTARQLPLDTDWFYAFSAIDGKLEPQAVDSVLRLEQENCQALFGVSYAMKMFGGQALVERLLRDGAPANYFDASRLESQVKLESLLGKDSPAMRRLLELEAGSGLILNRAAAFHNAEFIERLLTSPAAAERINSLGDLQSSFPRLAESFGANVDAIERAAELAQSQGLKVERINTFIAGGSKGLLHHSGIAGGPERAALAASEINRGATLAQLNDRHWLPGLELVERHFGADSPALRQTIRYGEQKRLNMWQVGSYLDENPAARLPVISKFIAAGFPEGAKDLMRLTMFPQETAERIAESAATGNVRVEQIIGHARDLESGENFVELVFRQTQLDKGLSSKTIDQLATEARNSAPLTSSFTAREPDQRRAKLMLGSHTPLPEFAEDLKEASEIILSRFGPDRTIVVLGRDMNVFAPVLRANGRKSIDFHLTRLQHDDASAARRWKEEVPPNAVVIDSGFAGTIPDMIKKFDSTIEPYLLKSTGSYPELISEFSSNKITDNLEAFPKMTGRCSGYRASGAAVCRLKSIDECDFLSPSLHASVWNRALLQELGLSDWYVWRYRTFTAVPRSERIGISSPERIQQYLNSVAQRRAQI